MKHIVIYVGILLSLFIQLSAFAENIQESTDNLTKLKTAYLGNRLYEKEMREKAAALEKESINTIMTNLELDTIKLEKGRRFIVICDRNINNNSIEGIPVKFESVQKEYIAYDKQPSKIIFQGIVEKTSKPKRGGKSGKIKIKLEKITIDSITYPVKALISKIDNKNVYFNTIGAAPCYLSNLANLTNPANDGIIHSSYKDPCGAQMCTTAVFKKPFIYMGAAALQAADLMLMPFAALTKKGNDINIPLNTYFEIKLDKDMYVLNL